MAAEPVLRLLPTPQVSLRPDRPGVGSWRFLPVQGCVHCAALFHPDDYEEIMERGWVTFDGQHADIVAEDCVPEVGSIRFRFRNPFVCPTPALASER